MFSFQGTCPAQVPEPKAKAKGSGRAGNRRPEVAVAPVTRSSEAEKGIAGEPSTKAGTEAWKQAEGRADKPKLKDGGGTGKNRCEGKPGGRERKKQKAE